ncbi:MAG: DUF11 domain-containing protein [Thermoanaerobaculia bacterium]|nr:DUF11 domain-containing protein [Thermoanaerobaculia bacterium]
MRYTLSLASIASTSIAREAETTRLTRLLTGVVFAVVLATTGTPASAHDVAFDREGTEQRVITQPEPGQVTEADLEMFKDAQVLAGNVVEYELFVANNGPDVAQGTTVVDDLPACMALMSDSCGGTNLPPWTWEIGDLPADDEASCILTLDGSGCSGLIVNTATVSSLAIDPSPGDETDTAEVLLEGSGATDIPTVPASGLVLLIAILTVVATTRLRTRVHR